MKLSDLGFKYFSQEFDWALPNGNVRVEESSKYKGFWALELNKNFKRNKYDNLLYVTRIPKASLMKFLENNIKGLKEFDKSPNKTFVNKIKNEVSSLSKPLRFKNMWMNYNFKMPSNAKKGILYEISSQGNNGFAKKVERVLIPILSKTIFSKAITDDSMSGNGDQTFFETKKKDRKLALSIPYIKRVNKYAGAVLMSNYYRGKVKGIGNDATLYYFVLVMGCDMEDDIADPSVCVEVITPIDKGEDFFLNEVKNAVAKFNPLKFSGKKIYVNKCPKSVTGSAEMKPYSYKGRVITAGSKQEAIKQIISKEDELGKLLEEIGILGKGNIRYEYTAPGKYDLVLNAERNHDFNGMWLGSITKKEGTKNYWFNTKNLECPIDKNNANKIKDQINQLIQFEIDRMKEEQDYLKSLKF